MRYEKLATLAGWTFYEGTDHGFTGEYAGRPLYGYVQAVPEGTAAGKPDVGEWYPSLEHAMVAAVAEKYTGRRGAGGTGVGTAADWFMRMVGANQLHAAGDAGKEALSVALQRNDLPGDRWAVQRIEKALETRGVVLARLKD